MTTGPQVWGDLDTPMRQYQQRRYGDVAWQWTFVPDLTTREDQVYQGNVAITNLGDVAAQRNSPPNLSGYTMSTPRMSLIMQQLTQTIAKFQNWVLGAP